MSNYPAPTENVPIFNSYYFIGSNSSYLTVSQGNSLYPQIKGAICSGLYTFSAGLATTNISSGGYAFTFPSKNGTFAMLSDITASSVSLSANQTWTGIQTFSTAPVIGTITNTGTLTLPTTTGTLALVSQIPSSSSFVDVSSNQTVAGIKTFSTPGSTLTQPYLVGPQIYGSSGGNGAFLFDTSAISNGFNLALKLNSLSAPQTLNFSAITSTDTLMTLGLAQTISSVKTFSAAPVISSITNTGTLTLPTTTGTLALVSQIPTNSSYVDLTSNQTVAGVKTFSTAGSSLTQPYLIGPQIYGTSGNGAFLFDTSGISNGFNLALKLNSLSAPQTLNFPVITATDTLMTLGLAQTISSVKTFSAAPVISTITNTGTLTLPTTTGYLLETVGNYSSVTSQGLTLSNAQTITTSAYLAGVTINAGATTYTDSATAASGTVGQVSDVLIGARTFNGTNTAITYTNAASLQITGPPVAGTNITITTPNAIQVDSGNVRLTNGRLLSIALGTAALPAFAIGALLTDGIYSSAAGSLNIATSGVLRATFSASSLTVPANYAITASGTSTFTSGSGGFNSAGPLSSSLASSATTCSVRPTNNANTGIFGTAATNISISVGATAIVSCSTTGTALTGTLSVSGLSTLTSGAKFGVGKTISWVDSGTTTSASVASGGGTQNFTVTFNSTAPSTTGLVVNVIPNAGAGLDKLTYGISALSTTAATIAAANPSSTAATAITFSWNAYVIS